MAKNVDITALQQAQQRPRSVTELVGTYERGWLPDDQLQPRGRRSADLIARRYRKRTKQLIRQRAIARTQPARDHAAQDRALEIVSDPNADLSKIPDQTWSLAMAALDRKAADGDRPSSAEIHAMSYRQAQDDMNEFTV